jgi:hypothetical protein
MQRLGVLLLLGVACAPSRATLLQRRATTYVFHRSADELSLAVTAYFDERGFDWDAPRPDGLRRTAWKQVYGEAEFASVLERYFVLVRARGPTHATVEVVKLSRTTAGMETYHPVNGSNSGREPKDVNPTEPMGKGSVPLPFGPPIAKRALEVEWELIRRLEPHRAAALESRVDASAAR